LKALLESKEIDVFDYRSVRALIEQKWVKARRAIQLKLFIPFICYLLYFQFFIENVLNDLGEADSEQILLWKRMSKVFLIIFALYFLIIEIKQMRSLGFSYFSIGSIWSIIDFIPLCISIAAMCIDFVF